MILLSRDVKVWVEIDGVEIREYSVTTSDIDGVETVTCYIEAKEEKEFIIRYQNTPRLPGCLTETKAFIDGNYAHGYIYCGENADARHKVRTIRGFAEKRTGTERIFRAFLFGKMATTHIGLPEDMPEEILNGACTIRVDIGIHKRIGNVNHHKPKSRLSTIPSQTPMHEDCKPALWGLSTRAGQLIKQPAARLCCCLKDVNAIFKQRVIFKYRSHNSLVAEGLKEAALFDRNSNLIDEDEINNGDHIGVDKEQVTVARSRARTEATSTRNVRVSHQLRQSLDLYSYMEV